jgi:hypothetical protein
MRGVNVKGRETVYSCFAGIFLPGRKKKRVLYERG